MKNLGSGRAVLSVFGAALAVSISFGPVTAHAQAPNPAPNPAKDTTKPAAAAPAKPAKPVDPKTLVASGEKKLKANDFAGALADFEAAETQKPNPANQRLIGLAHDGLSHFAQAVTAYEAFIAANPTKSAEQVEEAKKRVEAIKAMPGTVNVTTVPEGASIVVDTSQTPYEKTTPTEISLPPGKHTLLVGAEGYENATREVDVGFASKQDVSFELVKRPPPPPPEPVAEASVEKPAAPPPTPPAPEPRSKVPAYVTGAIAVAAAGVGTAFGISALSLSSDFEKKPTKETADDAENAALIADMMFGVAVTFGVTSAVLFLTSDAPASTASAPKTKVAANPASKQSVKIVPAPYVTPTGGGFGTLVRF